jgi:hypothetical protein
MELNSSGGLVGSVRTISNAAAGGLTNPPVQFFPNGNQLFIISGGQAYIDNGLGPIPVSVNPFSGTVETFGSLDVNWVSGDMFDPGFVGLPIVIGGTTYTVTQVFNENALTVNTLTPSAVAPYTAAAPPFNAVTGAYLNNTFFLNRPFSRQVNYSPVNDKTGSIWNGLDFLSKDAWPDHVRCILADSSQLYLFGDESIEVWQANPNSSTNPFQRIEGATSKIGTLSSWSPISINGKVYLLGGSSQGQPIGYVMNGFTPVRVSQHGQESQWAARNLGPNCISYSEIYEGHVFWVINFLTETWALDIVTGAWHQRATGNFGPYETCYHSYIPEFGNGKHLTGGRQDGKIYETSTAFYDDNGADIKWQKTIPHVYNSRNRVYFNRLELEMETGTATSGTPVVTMDYSDDRGHTFGGSEDASQGSSTQYSTRVFWSALGSSYDRMFRFTGTGKSRVCLIDLEAEIEEGTC